MRIETRQPESYPRTPPDLYNFSYVNVEQARYFLRAQCEPLQQTPAEGIYEFSDAYVYDGKHVLIGDSDAIEFTFADTENTSELIASIRQRIVAEDFKPLSIHPSYRDNKANVVICKRGAGNYGHFLVEMLPKLVILYEARIKDCTVWLPEESRLFVELVENLGRVLGLRIESAILDREELYRFPALVLPSPVSQHDSRKSYTLLQARDLLKHAYDIKSTPSRNSVFVCRSEAVSRRILNIGSVRQLMSDAGVVVLDPGAMSIKQQIEAFTSAQFVIGGLGAGMTNMLFCETGSKMVLITPGLGDNFFWDLCCLCGHSYTSIFAKPLDWYTYERACEDYHVPLRTLEECLHNLGLIA